VRDRSRDTIDRNLRTYYGRVVRFSNSEFETTHIRIMCVRTLRTRLVYFYDT